MRECIAREGILYACAAVRAISSMTSSSNEVADWAVAGNRRRRAQRKDVVLQGHLEQVRVSAPRNRQQNFMLGARHFHLVVDGNIHARIGQDGMECVWDL